MLALFKKDSEHDYQKQDALKALSIPNGIVHPLQLSNTGETENQQYGGVTDEKLCFVKESALTRRNPSHYKPFPEWYIGANPDTKNDAIHYVDETVVFLGPFSKHYGHFLLEGLARLWFYLDEKYINLKAVYLAEEGTDRFLDVFGFFGIPKSNLIKITKPTRFKTVIVPEQSIRLHDFYHIKYKETIDKIKEKIRPRKYKKVYFSKVGQCKEIGEKSIEAVFRRNGYKIVNPARITMKEVISILAGCHEFAGLSGTNSHNAIFLNDHARCVYLNRSPDVHYIQTMIDYMRNIEASYVDVYISYFPVNWSVGPFLLGSTPYLLDFLNAHHMRYSKKDLYKYCLENNVKYIKAWASYYHHPDRRQHLDVNEVLIDELLEQVANSFANADNMI